MSEICFRYSGPPSAQAVVADLHRIDPLTTAHSGGDPSVVHVPDALWSLALVPEITLGLGGRVTACDPAPGSGGCTAEADHEAGSEGTL